MGTTVISPESVPFPAPVSAPVLEIKASWADEWQYTPELRLMRASLAAGGQDLSSCEIRREYGRAKGPHESALSTRTPRDLVGWWLRLRLVGEQGVETAWLGQIHGEPRDIHGADDTRSGVQSWIAYGPRQMLRKIQIYTSWWREDDGSAVQLAWIPTMNARDERNLLVGNRSAERGNDGVYLYGGNENWSHYDYLEYLLTQHVQQDSGPVWRLGGQVDALKNVAETIPFDTTQTADEILRKLIPLRLGLDYKINPFAAADGDGFEIFVYALNGEEHSFGGHTLPRNPNAVRIKAAEAPDMIRSHVVRSAEHSYSGIRVVGKRLVVCCSLHGALCTHADRGSLIPKWTAELETAYKAGTGTPTDPASKHEAARRSEQFRTVYQQYGAPTDWDFNDHKALPLVTLAGELDAENYRAAQRYLRQTLSWLPLREGFDYTQDPPADNNPSWHEAEFLPPMAWAFLDGLGRYFAVDAMPSFMSYLNMRLSVSQHDWGILLQPDVNHRLAENHWTGAAPYEHPPSVDHEGLVATIAFETDERLVLGVDFAEGDGTTQVIEVPDAEFWYLAAGTVVGLEVPCPDDHVGLLYADTGIVLRNDADRLALVMAGAIARYHAERARAEIVIKGLVPWGGLLGQILTVLEEGGDMETIQAPITAVEWQSGNEPMTILRTGFAR